MAMAGRQAGQKMYAQYIIIIKSLLLWVAYSGFLTMAQVFVGKNIRGGSKILEGGGVSDGISPNGWPRSEVHNKILKMGIVI